MSQTIKLKRSSVAGNVPTTAQLSLGEVAINTHDGKLFIKKDDGTASIIEVGSVPAGYNNTNWDTAYGWGDHSSAGYSTTDTTYTAGSGLILTGTEFKIRWNATDTFTGTYPLVWKASDIPYTSTWLNVNGATDTLHSVNFEASGTVTASGGNSTNWNTAYSWGNHASAGYLTSLPSHVHTIANVTGLQTALDGKVDDSQVLTNVPSGAVFTDTNTWRPIHDSPVNGATTTSISSNWAFDNVKTAVPTGAVFTDTVYSHPSSHPATMITTTDEFTYSNSSNVQDVLDDLDQAIANVNAKDPVLTLTGDVTGTATFTNLGNATLTATVANDSHTHDEAGSIDIVDTRNEGVRLPNDYDDKRVTAEFTDDISGAWWSALTVKGWSDGYSPWQIIGHASTGLNESLYARFGNGGANTWTSLRKIFHDGQEIINTNHIKVDNNAWFWSRYSASHDWVRINANTSGGLDVYNQTDSAFANIRTGSYSIGSTTVIDSSRNLTNIGSISASGGISVSGYNTISSYAGDFEFITGSLTGNVTGNLTGNASTATSAGRWTTARTLSLTGDASGSVSWDGSSNASLSVTVNNDSHTHDGRYYTESEADSRFVNTSGDTMTGTLTVPNLTIGSGNKIKFANNDYIRYDDSANRFHFDVDGGLSNGSVKASTFIGALSGNASTASRWATARTLSLTGDVTGSVSWDGSGNATLSTSVGDAQTIDGFDSTRLYRRISSVSATASAGWVSVAECTSGRKHSEIIVSDAESGDHAFIRIDWMRSYADSNFSVLQVGGHANRITGARVLYETANNTYGKKILQVYVTTTSNYGVRISSLGDPKGFGAITATTPVTQNSISGYAVHGSELTNLQDVTLAAEEGIKAGGNIYANNTQRVFADNYHPNADRWTTSRTLSLTGDVTGSVSWDGSGNASLSATVADDSHNHTIANIDGLQTALNGKQAAGTYNTIIGTDSDINTSGSTIIDNIYVTDGVITSMGTRTLTTGDIGALPSSHDMTLTLNGDVSGSATFTNMGNATLSVAVNNDSHTHDTRYVRQGGTSFNGEYPMVVRVSDRNFYSDGNVKFRGSDSRLTVDGIVNTPTYQVNGTTVIDSSRNLANITSLTATGNITANNGWVKSGSGGFYVSGNQIVNSSRDLLNIGNITCSGTNNTYGEINIREDASAPGYTFMRFQAYSTGNTLGSIYRLYGSMYYSTSSDYRLKENVADLTSASDRVNELSVKRFNFIDHPDRTVDGFLAHEVAEVVPEAVLGEKDAVDANGNPEYQSIDQSKLVPLLTAGLQEALAKIETLEARLSALENEE